MHKAGTEMMIKMEKNMDLKNKYDSIIFDLDGTLWNSSKPICEAWNIILDRHKEIVREPITIEELGQCMGLPMYDIAAKLFPDEKEEVRNALMDELCEFENGYLEKMGGVLFPELEATLKELKTKYPLYIVSNCQDGYIEAFIKAHKLEKYSSAMILYFFNNANEKILITAVNPVGKAFDIIFFKKLPLILSLLGSKANIKEGIPIVTKLIKLS